MRPIALLFVLGCAPSTSLRDADVPAGAWENQGRTFRAHPGFAVTLDEQGLHASAEGAELSLALRAWGRADALVPAERGAPGWGALDRIDRDLGGATEWVALRDRGVQQGWDLERRPGGSGPLRLEIDATGAWRAVAMEDGFLLTDRLGGVWSYADIGAWDADGDPLEVDLSVSPGGALVLEVEDAGARWPILVDPVLSSPTTTLEGTGSLSSPDFGRKLGSAGDLDGDGDEELLVYAPSFGNEDGALFVYEGDPSGLSESPDRTLTDTSLSYFGAFARLGDLNGDGYEDVGVYGLGSAAYVYYGSSEGLESTAGESLSPSSGCYAYPFPVGDVNNDGFDELLLMSSSSCSPQVLEVHAGSADGVSSSASTTFTSTGARYYLSAGPAGDVNADGYDDLVALSYVAGAGQIEVMHGGSSGVSSTATTTLSGYSSSDVQYSPLDADNDGYGDLAVVDGSTRNAYVYHGSASGLSSSAKTRLTSSSASLTWRALSTGDANADGYDDLALNESGTSSWQITVRHGSSSGIASAAATTITATSSTSRYGVPALVDLDGDGDDDLAVGLPDASDAEEVQIFPSSSSGAASSATTVLPGPSRSEFGWTVSQADVDGDGYDDVIVGDLYADQVQIFLGSAAGLDDEADTVLEGDDTFGTVVAGAGDLDGDGYEDVAVVNGYTATVDVFLGSATGPGADPDVSLLSTIRLTSYPVMASAGDVNGDGYGDLIVGDYAASGYKGKVYLFYGSASGPSDADVTTLSGTGGYFGGAVAGAHDVNGDGYDDVVISAPTLTSSAGAVYLYLGSASGLSSTATSSLSGSAGAGLGYALAGPGDVDGDGYADVVISAPFRSGGVGTVYLHRGSSTGLASSATSTYTGSTSGSYLGYRLAVVGDVNGDGLQDVLAGPYSDGDVVLLQALSTGYASSTATVLSGPAGSGSYGLSLAGGDLDGDGLGDLLIGAPTTGTSGVVYVYPGYNDDDDDLDGYIADEDCDDTDASVNEPLTWYADGDGDGYGDADATTAACDAPDGSVGVSGDCDDADPDANPGETERCDDGARDEDCDGLTDDADPSVSGETIWYTDADGDGYGDDDAATEACAAPSGAVALGGDCDDTDASVSPGAAEACDASDQDEDCDGLADDADEGAEGASTWYTDADGDGYGDSETGRVLCEAPAGAVAQGGDCDDGDALVSPDAVEVCDATDVDEDCDGLADDEDDAVSSASLHLYYADADGDGYGDASAPTIACDAPTGTVEDDSDCDDENAGRNPGEPEVCDDLDIDEDCDDLADDLDTEAEGASTWYTDADGDSYGDPAAPVLACDVPEGAVADATDCDDASALAHPGGVEVCDDEDADEDCDGLADDDDDAVSSASLSVYYADADGDGYGDATATQIQCDPSEGYGADATDCDDADASAYPGASEVAGDGVDQDCDGADTPAGSPDDTGEPDDTGAPSGEGGEGGGEDGEKVGCTGCASSPARPALPLSLGLAILLVRRRRWTTR